MNNENMKQLMENLEKLPAMAAVIHPTTEKPIIVQKGFKGYLNTDEDFDPDLFNQEYGVTKAQAEAMLVGSMFGFEVPGANPDDYEDVA